MTLDMNNTDKLSEFRSEARRLNITLHPPSINRSGVAFDVDGDTIIYALAALKGVGVQAVEAIVGARSAKPFSDLADFAARINPRSVNKRVLESLAAAGAFDELDPNRASVFAGMDVVLGRAQRTHESAAIGQSDMFGGSSGPEPIVLPKVEPWLPSDRLKREYDAIGFFLSGHPLDDYAAALNRMNAQNWAEFSNSVKNGATAGKVGATVVSRMERRTKSGSKMGIFGLSDPTGHYEAIVFSEGLADYRELLEPGANVLLFLSGEVQGDEVRARIQSATALDTVSAAIPAGLRIHLRDAEPLDSIRNRLDKRVDTRSGQGGGQRSSLGSNQGNDYGGGEVTLVLQLRDGSEAQIRLPGRFRISPQIAGAIKAVPGVVQVETI
jgi:DNA polymerase-3 subunit alpha